MSKFHLREENIVLKNPFKKIKCNKVKAKKMSKNCLYLLEIILVNDEEVGRVLNYTEEKERVVCIKL